MNATIKRAELLDALGAIKPYLGRMPQLAFYVLTPGPKGIIAYTWNGNDALMVQVKARTSGKDAVLLPPAAVAFLSAVTAKDVTLSGSVKVESKEHQEQGHYDYSVQPSKWVEGKKSIIKLRHYSVKVEAGTSRNQYPTGDPADCQIGLKDIDKLRGVPLTRLDEGLDEVSYAMAKGRDEFNILKAVCLASTRKGLDVVACDGYRMAITTIATKVKLPERFAIADNVVAVLKGWKGRTTLRWKVMGKDKLTKVVFQNGPYTLVTSSVGEYPSYQHMVPSKMVKGITVSNAGLTEAVKVCATLVGADGTVRLITKGKKLQVVGLVDGSESITEIPAKGRMKQAYTAKYLQEMLKHVGEVVDIRHPAGSGQFAIAVVKTGGSYHVMMPREVEEWRKPSPASPAAKAAPVREAVAVGG